MKLKAGFVTFTVVIQCKAMQKKKKKKKELDLIILY